VLPLRALSERRTVALFFGALLILVLTRHAIAPVADPDVWWIAAAGRDGQTHAPTVNGYSFTDPDHPWVFHERLFGRLFATLLASIGPASIALFGCLAGATTIALVFMLASHRSRRLATASIASLSVLAGASAALVQPRPSYATLPFVVTMLALATVRRATWASAISAVVLEAIWTQTHGSFPLGVLLLAFGVLESSADARDRAARIATAIAAAFVTVLNPYGLQLHGLVVRYLAGGDATAALIHRNIAEFQPLWRAQAPFVDAMDLTVLVLVTLLAVSALAHRRSRARAALTLAFVALAIVQVRHVIVAIVVGALLMIDEIDALLDRANEPERKPFHPLLAASIVAPAIVVAGVAWSWMRARRSPLDWIDGSVGGAAVLTEADALPNGAHLWVPFDASGLVLYFESPRGLRLFFDPRNDCYSPEVAEAAFGIEARRGDPDPGATLARFGTEYALVMKTHPVATALTSSPRWRLARAHEGWLTFARSPLK
jgi:hypothetical protein